MSGKGKGAHLSKKGFHSGKFGKRHDKTQFRQNITKPAIRRLSLRGGVERCKQEVYPRMREVSDSFLKKIISCALKSTQYRDKKTVTSKDIEYGVFTTMGTKIYNSDQI
jgi:histone H4